MRKLTKLMLTLTLLTVGVGGVKATKLYADLSKDVKGSHVTWTASTNTLEWDLGYSNSFPLVGFSGDLSEYTTITISAPKYTSSDQSYRLIFYGANLPENGKVISFYTVGGTYTLADKGFTKEELSSVKSINLAGNSSKGSIAIEKVYLEKPMSLNIDEDGQAVVDKTDLVANGCLTFNDQTGDLVSNKGDEGASDWGTLSINFPKEGVDLSSLTGFKVKYTGTFLFSNFVIGSKDFWSSVDGRNDMASHITDEKVGDPKCVNKWQWGVSTKGEMNIESVTLQFNVMNAIDPHTTALTSSLYHKWDGVGADAKETSETYYCVNNIGSSNANVYGNTNVVALQYADLSKFDKLILTVTTGTPRLIFNRAGDQSSDYIEIKTSTSDYVTVDGNDWAIDLNKIVQEKGYAHLNCIKGLNGANVTVTDAVLYIQNVESPYDYIISGNGAQSKSVKAALADENATSIDATGLTKATALETANPNCLIVASEGMVTNEKNVIVGTSCANLELTDQKPFKAPFEFTAAKAKVAKSVSAARYATMVLPFGVSTLPEGVEAYDVKGVNDDALTIDKVDGIEAHKPVLLKNTGSFDFEAANVTVNNGDELKNGLLVGTYTTTDVPVGDSYVLQNQTEGGVGFYKAVSGTKVNAFRAYLSAQAAPSRLVIAENTTTGIAEIESGRQTTADRVYDMQGRRMEIAVGKGLYIVNGKKVVIK